MESKQTLRDALSEGERDELQHIMLREPVRPAHIHYPYAARALAARGLVVLVNGMWWVDWDAVKAGASRLVPV